MPYIEIRNLDFVYSKKTPFEKHALKNVNLDVEEGSVVGIVGATGSGKSTLIQHLNGLIKIQDKKRASIKIGEMSASYKKTLKKLRFEVGMVFQYPEYQLFGETVAKDVAFGPKNMKLPEDVIEARVRRALEVVGLDYGKFAERSPFDLSGGEKRRVAIAGVIAMEPKVLVLDEPVAGLDPAGREDVLALIKTLQREVSPTVIIVSHSMDDMARIADKIVVLKDGEIVADGTPKEVFSKRELVAEAGLELPTATRIACALADRGIKLDGTVVTMDELANALGDLLKKGKKNADVDNDVSDDEDISDGEDVPAEDDLDGGDYIACGDENEYDSQDDGVESEDAGGDGDV